METRKHGQRLNQVDLILRPPHLQARQLPSAGEDVFAVGVVDSHSIIQKRAVSQVNNHRAPIQRVDETRTSCSYGISRDEIHLVMDGLIPGSGRILE